MNCLACDEEIRFSVTPQKSVEVNCGCRDWNDTRDTSNEMPIDWPIDVGVLYAACDNVRDSA